MKLKTLVAALLIGAGLAGCEFPAQQSQAKAATPQNWVSLPALPFIEDAVRSLSPTFQGRRTEQFMPQICGMARGQISQEQVNAQLAAMGVDSTRIPRQSRDASALLVNGDRAAQATACAAYQATDVLMAVEAKDFLKPAPAAKDKPGEMTAQQLDDQALASVLPIKVAQARANADVFALIAGNLQRTPGLSVEQYRERARDLFSRLAPSYLARVPAKMPPVNSGYKVLGFDNGRLDFTSDIGLHFDFSTDKGLVLTQNGVHWYGKGQLLGQDYRVQVAYFQPDVAQLLSTAKK
ncbi:MAG: hypothetical protein QM805_23720 [Pseudomonas sp.]